MEELDVREPGFVCENVFHAALQIAEAHVCRYVETDYFVLFDVEHEELCVIFEVVSVRSGSEGETESQVPVIAADQLVLGYLEVELELILINKAKGVELSQLQVVAGSPKLQSDKSVVPCMEEGKVKLVIRITELVSDQVKLSFLDIYLSNIIFAPGVGHRNQ